MTRFPWRRTTLLMLACSGFLAGLPLGRRWPAGPFVLPLVGGLMALLASRHQRRLWFGLGCVLLGAGLGWWRGGVFRQQVLPYESLYRRIITVQVLAKTDGTYTAQTRNLAFDGGDVQVIEPTVGELPGILKFESRGLPAVFRGDRLELTGQLYPAGGSRQGSIKFAAGRLLDRRLNWLERFRLKFGAAIQSVLPEPQASVALGILVGQRTTLPETVNDQLSAVGLTHIIAVSGYNLTIIIRFLGMRVGRSKYQTLAVSIGMVSTFILITGFAASIVRAGIVSMLSIGAWYYGRTFKPLLVLLLSGVITAGWYPVYVWSDIGWYLSFLAFYGVLMLAPLVTTAVWKGRQPGGLMSLATESACAQIMAAPIIMYIFGETSLIALPANMLIVPLVPLAMLLSAIGGTAGLLLPGHGPWLAWPARILLGYMLQMIDWLSRTPGALWHQSLPGWLMIVVYGLIAGLCWRLWVKTRPAYGKITDEGDNS